MQATITRDGFVGQHNNCKALGVAILSDKKCMMPKDKSDPEEKILGFGFICTRTDSQCTALTCPCIHGG